MSGMASPRTATVVSLSCRSGSNQLTGPLPAELGGLTNLQTLNIGHNQLSGAIPDELGDLTDLQTVRLGYNRLAGAIPAWAG